MKELFVPIELALLLMEAGYHDPCLGYYNRTGQINTLSESPFGMYDYNSEPEQDDTKTPVSAPLYQQVVDWFGWKYNIEVEARCIQINSKRRKAYQATVISDNYNTFAQGGDFDTRLEALDKAIEEALKLI